MWLWSKDIGHLWVSVNADMAWERHWGVEWEWDYAWIAPAVVEGRKCDHRVAGYVNSVVLRWV